MTISTEKDDLTQLSELIKSTLTAKGLSQSDLAKACSINRGNISKLVNNKPPYPPSRKLLGAIAQTLNLDEYNLNLLAGHIPLSIKPLVLRFLVVTGDRAREISSCQKSIADLLDCPELPLKSSDQEPMMKAIFELVIRYADGNVVGQLDP